MYSEHGHPRRRYVSSVMNVIEPVTVVALTWLCIFAYAGLMYYWAAVPQYEQNVRRA